MSVQIEAKHDIYAPAGAGPFLCGNCEYFEATGDKYGQCDNRALVAVARTYKLDTQGGRAVVETRACCDYFERKGHART